MTLFRLNKPLPIVLLIIMQGLCAGFFLYDVITDGFEIGLGAFFVSHFGIEVIAVISLIAAIVFEMHLLRALLQSNAHLRHQASLAAQAFHAVIEARLTQWSLTPSERDVIHFTIKGFSITEIAQLRGSAEGTVKAHLNAIYRKAEVSNRGELLSLLIEDLMAHDL